MTVGSIDTNNGRIVLLNRGYKVTPDYLAPTQFKVGILNGTPLVTDTDLDNPVPISGTEAVDACDATTGWTASGTNSVALNTTSGERKEGTGCINIVKSDASSVNISVSKTTTSRDFTSKTVFVWVYIGTTAFAEMETTDCLTVRFGSAAGDYYQYTRDKADLSAGWNLIYFTSATADSSTGTPAIAACDYSFLQLTSDGAADTWSGNEVRMDDWEVASAGDFTKDFVSGYPTFDTTKHEVTMRCYLTLTEANGNDLNGLAIVNEDSSPLMTGEDTYNAESKSATDEFAYIVVDRLL